MNENNICTHCGEKIVIPSSLNIDNKELLFCCHGCKTVYSILHEQGLDQYYKLKEQSHVEKTGAVKVSNEKYLYLDQNSFQNKYTQKVGDTIVVKFYLEGIHCVACLWLIEKLPELLPGVLQSELNMSKSICTITCSEEQKLSEVAKQLEILGYKPHPVMQELEIQELAKKEDRKMLIKIAVAFACAGNIMLLATSLYAGLEEVFLKEYFRWLNFYLSLPIILYSAIPFYQSAWTSLKNKKISIDIPIVVAIIVVTISGVYSLLYNKDHLYFDSISVLVFLLLFSRYVLKKAQQKGLSATEVSTFFSNQTAYRINDLDQSKEPIHANLLKKYDKIYVAPGENIPVDGLVIQGTSNLNTSLLTGESLPEKVNKGDYVYSGTSNIDSPLIVQTINTTEDSRLGKILKSVESGWKQKAEIILFADKIAKYFVSTVFSLALLVALYFIFIDGSIEKGLVRALTLIIITCPCALGLTTPLALTLTLGRLAKNGIIVKNEHIIEKITKAKEIFLDKTGTLTYGSFQIIQWRELSQSFKDLNQIIFHLEKRSKHPVAKAICDYLQKDFYKKNKIINDMTISDFKEIPGIGVEGYYQSFFIEIKKSQLKIQDNSTQIGVFVDHKQVLDIQLKDQLREDSIKAIEQIKRSHLEPFIISGDNQLTVNEIAKKLNIGPNHYFSQISPEKKHQILKNYPQAIMVGDGANDAIALSSSFVGIAVHGSVDISLRAADVYISKSGVQHLSNLIQASHDTLKVIKRNLYFSLIYNIIGAALAINGLIDPLIAAVIMPISSLTVLASTFFSTKKLKQLDRFK